MHGSAKFEQKHPDQPKQRVSGGEFMEQFIDQPDTTVPYLNPARFFWLKACNIRVMQCRTGLLVNFNMAVCKLKLIHLSP